MLRHPPPQACSALFTRGGASLPSPIARLRPPAAGTRTAGPRPDVPLADHAPAPRAPLPDGLVARCLARMASAARRTDAVDDHRARRDPQTRPFAAIPTSDGDRLDDHDSRVPARVAGPADRPATAEMPVVDVG